MNDRFSTLFHSQMPLLGMLHLKGEGTEDILARAFRETEIMISCGMDGVIVEDYFGATDEVGMVLSAFSQRHVAFPYGISLLDKTHETFALARKYGAAFVQLDSVAGHLPVEEDKAFEEALQAERAAYSGAVLGGVRFKYTPYKSGRSLEEDLRLGMTRCDAICVTGDGTGLLTPISKLEEFRKIVGDDFPLIVAAGVTPESYPSQSRYVNGVIIGSYLKDTYKDTGEVDAEHVKKLVQAVRGSEANESN